MRFFWGRYAGNLLFFVLCLVVMMPPLAAQQKNKTIRTTDTIIQIDSFPLIPQSIQIQLTPNYPYQINYTKSVLIINKPLPDSLTIKLSYSTFAVALNMHQKQDSLVRYDFKNNSFSAHPNTVSALPFGAINNDSLQTEGYLNRGFTLGTNSGSSVENQINLHIEGLLNDSATIRAAISERNTPSGYFSGTYAPEEIDSMFLELQTPKTKIRLGHQTVRRDSLLFLKYEKKIKGLALQHQNKGVRWLGSFSLNRGEHKQIQLQLTEGNQGPYAIIDPINDAFVQVIEASEQVTLNGKVLLRGPDKDYTINYMSAQITFNNTIAISNHMRIFVRFEYVVRNYNRYLSEGQLNVHNHKHTFSVSAFRLADNKNQPVNSHFGADEIAFLQQQTTQNTTFLYPSVNFTNDNSQGITYRLTDSLVDGKVYDSIFVYSNNEYNNLFELTFSYVGELAGNYIQDSVAANGKIYKWVAPLNGTAQGNYQPVVKLMAPQRLTLIDVKYQNQLTQNQHLSVEMAQSEQVLNLYALSGKPAKKYAGNLGYRAHWHVGANQQLTLQTGLEFLNANFGSTQALTSPEKLRQWSITENTYTATNSKQANISLHYLSDTIFEATIHYNFLDLKPTGQLHELAAQTGISLPKISNRALLAGNISNFASQTRRFLKAQNNLQLNFKNHHAARYLLRYEANKKPTMELPPDTAKFQFIDHQLAFLHTDSAKPEWQVGYRYLNQTLATDSSNLVSQQFETHLKSKTQKTTQSDLLFRYRYNQYHTATSAPEKLYWLGWTIQRFDVKQALNGSFQAHVNSGSEQVRQYYFAPVMPGQGQFSWTDLNKNNIQEINEFLPAQFADQANYMRVFLPQNQLRSFKWYRAQANVSLNFGELSQLNHFLKNKPINLQVQQNIEAHQKNTATDWSIITDSARVVEQQLSVQSNVSFAYKKIKLLQYLHSLHQRLNNYYGLAEAQNNQKHQLQLNYQLATQWQLKQQIQTGTDEQTSIFLNQLSYSYRSWHAALERSATWKAEIASELKQTFIANKQLTNHKLKLNLSTATHTTHRLFFNATYVRIITPADIPLNQSYLLNEGFQAGINWQGQFQWSYRVHENFEVRANYLLRLLAQSNGAVQQIQLSARVNL